MGEIPDDIIDAAENTWNAIEDAEGIREFILTIAESILAERERCAKIAEECPVHSLLWRDSIANAIRGGN